MSTAGRPEEQGDQKYNIDWGFEHGSTVNGIVRYAEAMLSFLFLSVSMFSCALDKQAIRQSDREEDMLQNVAQQYWDGIRWGHTDRAALFVKDEKTRALYQGQLSFEGSTLRYVDAKVLHAEVSAEKREKDAEWLREGTVLVHIEVYGVNSVLEVSNIEQEWQRDLEGWWLKINIEPE